MLKDYYATLTRLIFRPILFYTRMPEGGASDKPVTFVGITAALLALALTLIIFITQYVIIGATLLEKVPPAKTVIIVPVMLMLAFMFFVITFALLFGLIVAVLLALSWGLAILLFVTSNALGGKGDYLSDLKASFYAMGTTLAFILPMLLIPLAKRGIIDFTNFLIGYNMLYSFWVLYLYGLLSIVSRKVHKLPKGKAFIGTLLPVVFLILAGIAAYYIVMPKAMPFII